VNAPGPPAGFGMPMPPVPPPVFSLKRGLLHAGLALGAVLAAGVLLAVLARPVAMEEFGGGLARFALFTAFLAFGASYLFQTGRRMWGWVTVAAYGALVVAVVVVVALVSPVRREGPRPAPLTPAERAPLVQVADGDTLLLRHPTLGFSLPHPGPAFAEVDQAELRRLARGMFEPGMQVYGWFDETAGAVLVVGLMKDVGSRDELEGFQQGFIQALREQPGSRLETNTVTWSGDGGEADVRGTLPDGTAVSARGQVVRLAPGGPRYLIVLAAFTFEPGALDFVLDGLRFDGIHGAALPAGDDGCSAPVCCARVARLSPMERRGEVGTPPASEWRPAHPPGQATSSSSSAPRWYCSSGG
jgi:hypothetical protein